MLQSSTFVSLQPGRWRCGLRLRTSSAIQCRCTFLRCHRRRARLDLPHAALMYLHPSTTIRRPHRPVDQVAPPRQALTFRLSDTFQVGQPWPVDPRSVWQRAGQQQAEAVQHWDSYHVVHKLDNNIRWNTTVLHGRAHWRPHRGHRWNSIHPHRETRRDRAPWRPPRGRPGVRRLHRQRCCSKALPPTAKYHQCSHRCCCQLT